MNLRRAGLEGLDRIEHVDFEVHVRHPCGGCNRNISFKGQICVSKYRFRRLAHQAYENSWICPEIVS